MRNRLRWWIALVLAAAGCNAPAPPATHGTDAQAGLVVVDTDYSSSNVALLGQDGTLLSPSLVSSGSGSAGLSAMLSGDVVLPGPAVHGKIVVIDRGSKSNVISWVDPATTKVVQLSVATGSSSNPQDYVAASPHQAFVPELEGKDLLVIDPSVPRITGRIDLMPAMKGADPKYLPRANRVVLAGGRLYVLLSGYASFCGDPSPESRLASIDLSTHRVDDVLVLEGLHDCTAMALSPDGGTLAVDCWGFDQCAKDPVIAESGVALVSIGSSFALDRTFAAADLGQGAPAFVAWSAVHKLLVSTFGKFTNSGDVARPDSLMELDTATGQHRELLTSDPFALGDVRCLPGKVCFAADAGRSVVDRFSVGADGRVGEPKAFRAGAALGLPPRYLGWFDASGG